MKIFKVLFIIVVTTYIAINQASASIVLDQQSRTLDDLYITVSGGGRQSFTPGISGYLYRFDLGIRKEFDDTEDLSERQSFVVEIWSEQFESLLGSATLEPEEFLGRESRSFFFSPLIFLAKEYI